MTSQAEADTFTQLFYSWAAYYGYSFPKNTIEVWSSEQIGLIALLARHF